jgi:hypothetical protein
VSLSFCLYSFASHSLSISLVLSLSTILPLIYFSILFRSLFVHLYNLAIRPPIYLHPYYCVCACFVCMYSCVFSLV